MNEPSGTPEPDLFTNPNGIHTADTPPMGLPIDGAFDRESFAPSALPKIRTALMVAASTGVTGWLAGRSATAVAGDKMAPWILGRASGICSYLLLVALVALGLILSHPWRGRWNRPSAVVRIRAHVSLSAFTLAFLVLHIVVLATDKYAKVGWWGALLPMASDYRPVPVTLGVIATYGGLIAGLTAAMAGRWAAKVWWPVHKVASLSLVLALLHGIFAGVDTKALAWMYVVTSVGLVALAASRYLASTPDDRVEAFIAGSEHSGGRFRR